MIIMPSFNENKILNDLYDDFKKHQERNGRAKETIKTNERAYKRFKATPHKASETRHGKIGT